MVKVEGKNFLTGWVHTDANALDVLARSASWAGTRSSLTLADKNAEVITLLVLEDALSSGGVALWVVGWASVLEDTGALGKASITLESLDLSGLLVGHATAGWVTVMGWVGTDSEGIVKLFFDIS